MPKYYETFCVGDKVKSLCHINPRLCGFVTRAKPSEMVIVDFGYHPRTLFYLNELQLIMRKMV